LSYNSQNWRIGYSPAGTNGGGNGTGPWLLGEDTGYGFGWTLQAGSLTPVYGGYYTIDHYIFTDATGAQYSLNQNSGNVWSSTSSVYIWYDANVKKLHFPDGSFWEFACQSAGTEQDAGTSYPTLMEDSNGNQVTVAYNDGVNTTWPNSSSRIQNITDVRAYGQPTYAFTYNSDAIPHLTAISNYAGTAENYTVALLKGQTLESPFTHNPASFGTTTLLQSLTQSGIFTTSFTYDTVGAGTSGALSQATFPYGGHLRWGYSEYNYANGQALMEVTNRYLAMTNSGTPEYSYSMARPNDQGNTTHSSACWTDSTGNAEKIWNFQTNGAQLNAGLTTNFSQGTPSGSTCTLNYVNSQDTYTWAADPAGRPYLGTDVATVDPGQPYAVQKQTVQTPDAYGNITQTQAWDYIPATQSFGSSPTRTTTNTYLTNSNYTSAYIYNRLVTSTVTSGSNTAYLASNSYDGSALTNVTNMPEHDSAYTTSVVYRGNPTTITTPTSTVTQAYDIGGNVTGTTNNGVTSSVSTTSATNYAEPSSVTTNALSTSMTWSGALAVTGVTDPNNDQATMAYDAISRPTTTTSPYGATTTYTYNDSASPPNHVATTNGHFVTTILDGFGRTVQKNTGYGASPGTLVSTVYTTYAPCGCSPLGKVSAVSQPWVSGTVYSTTYTYDAMGRPTAIGAPDSTTNPSTTKYAYKGNQVTVTDPANNSKIYTMDSATC
jgi:YD repeat-containing protein